MSSVFGEEGVEEGLIWPTSRGGAGWIVFTYDSRDSKSGRLLVFILCACASVCRNDNMFIMKKEVVLGPAIPGLGYLLYAVDHLVC
jgi:hypothetical protein